jgi:hypothetical protein
MALALALMKQQQQVQVPFLEFGVRGAAAVFTSSLVYKKMSPRYLSSQSSKLEGFPESKKSF